MHQQPSPDGRPVVGPLRDVVTGLGKALLEDMWRLADSELGDALDLLDQARVCIERLAVSAVAQAGERGTATTAGARCLTDWVAAHSPSVRPQDSHQLVTVATACRQPHHDPLAQAVRCGAVPVRKAALILSTLAQVRPFVTDEQYQQDQQILLPLAATGTDKDLSIATRHLVGCVVPDTDPDKADKAQRAARGITERPGPGGTTDLLVRADPEGAAFIHAIIDPLAKPVPDADGPDPRSPAQRRYDALMTILRRGMASPEGVPTTAKAKVIVTLTYDQLAGATNGVGLTATGDTLPAATIRRLACDADLVPAVFGTRSELLDLGRRARLATPAQHQALWLRDRHCTYPGCTIPAQWCDAHHLTWWSRGGRTNVSEMALLCGRHHTLAHDRDLRATLTDNTITWHT